MLKVLMRAARKLNPIRRMTGLDEELRFWDNWLATRGDQWPQDFENRLDPGLALQDDIREYVDQLPADVIRIADIGAGPLTKLGKIQRSGFRSDRRASRKLHLAVDADTSEILASEVTTHRSRDASQGPELLNLIDDELASFTADGAYDVTPVYEAVDKHPSVQPTRVVIPPRRNARLSRTGTSQRDKNIRWIGVVGRRRWEKESRYTRRSLVEVAISRYRRIIGRRLRSRTLPSQRTEARIGCAVLNRMTRLGMPDSYRAA